MKDPIAILWFKRDLRVVDHAPLAVAAKKTKLLPLYILEPELWKQPDMSYRQYLFLLECLKDLNQQLQTLGCTLNLQVGEALPVFERLLESFQVTGVYSHQETASDWTYQRDLRLKRFFKSRSIPWFEMRQQGVFRPLESRDLWAKKWHAWMLQPLVNLSRSDVQEGACTIESMQAPSAAALGLAPDGICMHSRQKGGRAQGLELLQSFLYHRGQNYTKEMSSPVTACSSCSRLSPYLAMGCISIREVFQKAGEREKQLYQLPIKERGAWPQSLRSFLSRLRWHCHFIQKLEDQPSIEFEAMHPGYRNLRVPQNSQQQERADFLLSAWKEGKTGYPMIDACMRKLIQTGWINFRMRAMLMSFASYHLWLDWKKPAQYLASLFVDYEPGIHYPQVQMQSGITGMNAIRIYNPIKQGLDQDPEAVFIREHIPELSNIAKSFCHTPWLYPGIETTGYPLPIVEEKSARKKAADKIYALRKSPLNREISSEVVRKHASRSKPKGVQARKKKPPSDEGQLELSF